MAKTHTLKLGGAEPVLPGLALPEAFESLDKRIESTVQFCRLKGSVESQILGLVTVCQEMQRLLKFAFIENGLLASRIEILTRHQSETLKKMDKKLSGIEIEHRVTKKQVKRLRRRLSEYETIQRKASGEWWDIKVSSSDYESLTTLSRSAGYPDLDFMLRINQILIDFVKDQDKNELVLPPMGNEERAEVSKIASIYKLRCRYGKSTHLAPSTLIKARQTCIPLTGEVDSLLENFAKTHRRVGADEGGSDTKPDSPTKPETTSKGTEPQTPSSLTISDIPPTMLTPLSSLSSPNTIDIGSTPISVTPAQSPTGIATPHPPPTTDHSSKTRKSASTSSTGSNSSSSGQSTSTATKPPSGKVGGQSHPQQPLPGQPPSSSSSSSNESSSAPLRKEGGTTETGKVPGSGGGVAGSNAAAGGGGGGVVGAVAGGDHVTPPSKTPAGVVTATALNQRQATQSTTNQGNIYISHQGHVRPMVPPTVVASPLKFPLSHLPTAVQGNTPASNTPPTTTASTGGGGGAVGGATGEAGVATAGGGGESGGETGGGAGSGSGKRERESSTSSPGGTPSKRVRVTRKSASGNGEE